MTDWLAADWPSPAGVVAGTSLRCGGISDGPYRSLNIAAHVGDEAGHVDENRRRLRGSRGLPDEPCWLCQQHGSRVVVLPAAAYPAADAAITRQAGVVCAIQSADCLPVVLAAADGSAVGAAHAGWRGLSAGILERTVAAFGIPAERLRAWLGPAISQPCFEVGDEVRDAFVAAHAMAASCFERNARGRWQADLYGLARQRLAAAGVHDVHGGGRCTYRESAAFYSYRRDGRCGRMATLVWRRGALP